MNVKTPELVIKTLASLGVDRLFHLPGTSLAMFYGRIARQQRIKSILCKHEQAACFAAAGYALVTNRPGVCMAMNGPGVTNLISAIAECYYQSIPIVAITVDNPRENLGSESFHEVDSFSMLEPVTKKVFYPETVKDVQKAITEAITCATTGRPAPVYLNIPVTLMGQSVTMKDMSIKQKPCRPSPANVKKALKTIGASKDPVIYAGSGVLRSGAEKELEEFMSLTGIPVMTSLGGRGAVPEGKPLVMGMPSYTYDINFLNESDLFIVLGTRLNSVNMRMGMLKPKKILQVDIDDRNPKLRKVDSYVQADVKECLTLFNREIKKIPDFKKPAGSRIYDTFKKTYSDFTANEYNNIRKNSSQFTAKRFLLELSKFLEKRDATLFSDSIWIPYPHLLPRSRKPRSFFSMRSFGCLGFALPAAIGACIAYPKRKNISLSGDGAFLFNCQDLSTAANYGLKNFVQIIFNNSGYASLHNIASSSFKRQDDYYLWNKIDYHGLSESFGVKAITVDKPSKINRALTKAFSGDGPYVINVMTDDREDVGKPFWTE